MRLYLSVTFWAIASLMRTSYTKNLALSVHRSLTYETNFRRSRKVPCSAWEVCATWGRCERCCALKSKSQQNVCALRCAAVNNVAEGCVTRSARTITWASSSSIRSRAHCSSPLRTLPPTDTDTPMKECFGPWISEN
ncbi:hypothetical protein BC826DRAFT_258593 [Russula brevipes]|nr:hypothetical protein BC826DRAFT_258593 [Russula brevipes]